jgi:ADP-dependent NAD(P)H-hydrate dehydratase / NAD(P)H-hydrate epimerase
MKILTAKQIKEADKFTIINEPVSSVDLMERAAQAVTSRLLEKVTEKIKIRIFAGTGNNGGDGLAIGRLLIENGVLTDIFLLDPESGYSPDTSINLERLKRMNVVPVIIKSESDFPAIHPSEMVIDALFGTGLSRPVTGLAARLIDHLNASAAEIVAIDIPSGLFCDDNRNNTGGSIIRAKCTLSFEFPKLSFMLPENEIYTGEWEIIQIGLHKEFIDGVKTNNFLVTSELAGPLIKKRKRFAHKGNFGHCLLISGSYGKMGAAVLAATSCLRSGAGLLTVHVPAKGCEILQISLPEAMVSIDISGVCFSSPPSLKKYDAIGAGPGLGTFEQTRKGLLDLLKSATQPLVLDADALNIISLDKEWISLIPENSILTPHPREFDRLFGQHNNSHDRLISQVEKAGNHKIVIVLKGAHTSIATPEGTCFFNNSGNPGMATAGSGDILTGIILSLLGQGYLPAEAAVAGVFIHGLAGDMACSGSSPEAMIAGDINHYLGKAFNILKT